MVRTDSREMKLDAFIRPSSLQQPSQPNNSQTNTDNQNDPTEMDTTMAATGSEGCVTSKRPREPQNVSNSSSVR